MKKSVITLGIIGCATLLSGCDSDNIKGELKKNYGFSMEDGAQEMMKGYQPFRFAIVNNREENLTVKLHYQSKAGGLLLGQDLTAQTSLNKLVRMPGMDLEQVDQLLIGHDYSLQVRPENRSNKFKLTIKEGIFDNGDWSIDFNQAQNDFGYYLVMHSDTDHPHQTEYSPVIKMKLEADDLKKSMSGFVNRLSLTELSAEETNICVFVKTENENILISKNLPYNSSSMMFDIDKVANLDQQEAKFIIVANTSLQGLVGHAQNKLTDTDVDYAQQYCEIDGKNNRENYWVLEGNLKEVSDENSAIVLSVEHSELEASAIELPSLKWKKETWK